MSGVRERRPDELGPTKELVAITIDGRELQAPVGAYLLGVARDAGIEIPTLCEHPAVEPVGACRLCMVEVGHPDWKGWTGLMTACLYPASRGLQVQTDSERVRQARRQVLTLLAARCPGSKTIRSLAERHGASVPAELLSDPEADGCILCGLCTRVCETWATAAITTYSRGSSKTVGSGDGAPPDACVACGACAEICPTGAIAAAREQGGYLIWDRRFETAVCAVDESACHGCGACEEACPFGVARVALRRAGGSAAGSDRIALIPAEACRGCGACVGACPSGAIDQHAPVSTAELLSGVADDTRLTVFACGRANLAGKHGLEARLREVPCTGRISASLLLAELAAGREGVLVLGRHEETCRLRGAEAPARARAARVSELVGLLGLGAERVRFLQPEAGLNGPERAIAKFRAGLGELAPRTPAVAIPEDGIEGLDGALALCRAIARHGRIEGEVYLARRGLQPFSPGGPALCAGILPYLDLLAAPWLEPLEVAEALHAALEVLDRLGVVGAGISISGPGPLGAADATALRGAGALFAIDPTEVERLRAAGLPVTGLSELLRERGRALPRPALPAQVACSDAGDATLCEALGYRALDAGPDPLPDRFRLGPGERRLAEQHLDRLERAGAAAILCRTPASLARWSLCTRHGTWRSTRIAALLPHQLAHRALRGASLAQTAAWRPPRPTSLEVQP